MKTKSICRAIAAAVALCAAANANAATFTGELYWGSWDSYDDCDLCSENADSADWRDGFVEVDGKREPAAWSVDQFVYPVTIEPGESFSAEVVHITSTPAHIKSVEVYSDEEMFNRYKGGDEDGEYVPKLWPENATKETRAWIVVSLNTVTDAETYTFDYATAPIVNDPDSPRFYNPADGDGEPSSKWTVTSYAKEFGVSLTGTRKVTKSVSFDVKISETDMTFGQRVWNVCSPFNVDGSENDWDSVDKVDDNGGDGDLIVAVGLWFVTDEMIKNQSDSPSPVVIGGWTATKAKVLDGAVYDAEGNVAGVVQLKVAKPNAKKHNAKVSGAVTLLDGKKRTLKAATANVSSDNPITANLAVKGLGTLAVTIGDDGFRGTLGTYTVATAKVGGKWQTAAKVYADATSALPAGTVESLLPDGVSVRVKGGKWSFDKAASITYKKGVLGGDNDPKKPNRSAMKLTYTPKTGLFKGSFKVYAIQSGKLKKYTVKVTGVVVDGEGTGVGKLAKPATTWRVRVSG